jgi:hypothetical protein
MRQQKTLLKKEEDEKANMLLMEVSQPKSNAAEVHAVA